MQQHVIVKYHELGIKGRNRPWFIAQLANNLARATSDLAVDRVWKGQMMIGLTLPNDSQWPVVRERVRDTMGVAKLFLAHKTPLDIEAVKALLSRLLKGRRLASFRITTNRAYKQFPRRSEEIDREVGAHVQQITGSPVDLNDPAFVIYIEVLPREIFVYFDEVKGYGGLPVGTGGKLMAKLSGGIDSPVAAWQMMKRGCVLDMIHFHSHPMVDTSSIEKAQELAQKLTHYQHDTRLFLVPFSEIQKRIIVSTPIPYRVVLYRRFMMRIAEALAEKQRAGAIVTGESLGQVASQTLENITTIEDAATMPIFRPLIGMNKQEVVDIARRIGTFETSSLKDQDCCSLFVPPHPATRSEPDVIREMESLMPVEDMMKEALAGVEAREFQFP